MAKTVITGASGASTAAIAPVKTGRRSSEGGK